MKKILFISMIALVSFASCKKDRTCTCTDSSTEPGYVSTTSITTYTEAKKGDARAACLSGTSTSTSTYVGGSTTTTTVATCSLSK